MEIVICLNKIDLAEEREVKEIERKYLNIGYEVLTLSAKKKVWY